LDVVDRDVLNRRIQTERVSVLPCKLTVSV
jgi:hypothetical protein